MKVLLIEPNVHSFALLPSISLAVLKGYIVTKTTHQAKILDLVFHKNHWQHYLREEIIREQPDLIGISVLSFNYTEALQIARWIKQHFPLPIIFGGVHVILSPEEVIRQQEVDIICIGEGEEVLKELLDHQLDCTTISGIWYKKNNTLIKNTPRTLMDNLDAYAFPDFSDFDMQKYFVINHHHLPIMASRGCPYHCTYCSNHALKKTLQGPYVRFRSVDNVIEEIDLRMRQYEGSGLKFLYFFDDTFILDKAFVSEFCRRYTEKGYHHLMKWNVNIRANLVDTALIRMMKDAGCYQVRMGIETGNEHLRNTIYKRDMSNEQIINAFRIIHENKLQLRLYFMVGAPTETFAMMQESLRLAQVSHTDETFFTPLYPLPGTEIRRMCEDEQIITAVDDGNQPVNHTHYVSESQLQRFMKQVRRWQIRTYLVEGIRSHGVLFFLDCLFFLLYYQPRYDFEKNQVLRWNVQRYKQKKI